jgi:hypothetical protein
MVQAVCSYETDFLLEFLSEPEDGDRIFLRSDSEAVCFLLISLLAHSSTLTIEAGCSSETSLKLPVSC